MSALDLAADEVVARVFFELYEQRVGLPPSADRKFSRCVGLIIDKLLREALEQATRRTPVEKIISELEASRPDLDLRRPPVDLSPEEMSEVVAQSFATLPEISRRCLHLYLVEGKSIPDIAQCLGITVNGVCQKIMEAQRRSLALARERYRQRRAGLESSGLEGGEPPPQDDHREPDEREEGAP
ncbi:MAG: hypothetical protein AB1486_25940 [Planctomycetota bacterium]